MADLEAGEKSNSSDYCHKLSSSTRTPALYLAQANRSVIITPKPSLDHRISRFKSFLRQTTILQGWPPNHERVAAVTRNRPNNSPTWKSDSKPMKINFQASIKHFKISSWRSRGYKGCWEPKCSTFAYRVRYQPQSRSQHISTIFTEQLRLYVVQLHFLGYASWFFCRPSWQS